MDHHSKSTDRQIALFKQKRFFPFLLTQFLGALNDNVFKNSLILLITYGALINEDIKGNSSLYTNAAAMLFILPFFLFSPIAGQISDKIEKSILIRRIKALEIIIMCLAVVAFYFESMLGLLAVLFLMGTQSSFFGPVKFSIIPQHLHKDELVSGNAQVEAGTFLAILLGTIVAGILLNTDSPTLYISMAVIVFSIAGYLSSRHIPAAPAAAPSLKINWNIFSQIIKTLSYTREIKSVFYSIIAISWFWFLGAAYLTQIPEYSKTVLGGDNNVVIILLTLFSIGISIGSLLCKKISGGYLNTGLVSVGFLGLSIFGIDLSFQSLPPIQDGLRNISEFITTPNAIHILVDVGFIGIFGGLYIIPLYTIVQQRTSPSVISRVIAGNNIINAFFMVMSAVLGAVLLGLGSYSIPDFFLIISIMNIVVSIIICTSIPEFVLNLNIKTNS